MSNVSPSPTSDDASSPQTDRFEVFVAILLGLAAIGGKLETPRTGLGAFEATRLGILVDPAPDSQIDLTHPLSERVSLSFTPPDARDLVDRRAWVVVSLPEGGQLLLPPTAAERSPILDLPAPRLELPVVLQRGQRHAGPLRHGLHRLGEREALQLHHEVEDRAPLPAAEAVKNPLRRADRKRRGLLLVEGAAGRPVRALLLELDVVRHDAHDVGLSPEVEFIFISSYGAGTTSGEVRVLRDIDNDVAGRDVLLIDDILESGKTLSFARDLMLSRGAKSCSLAVLLDKRMREIRDAGKVTGTDRIAVMTALNFAHELLRERRAAAAASAGAIDGESARRRIQSMQTAIDAALAGQEKLF